MDGMLLAVGLGIGSILGFYLALYRVSGAVEASYKAGYQQGLEDTREAVREDWEAKQAAFRKLMKAQEKTFYQIGYNVGRQTTGDSGRVV